VLRGPAALGATAIVVGPHDLVEEAPSTEDLVEQQLAVVRLSVIDVEIEGAVLAQQPARFEKARLQELEVVVVGVLVELPRDRRAAISAPLEPAPVAFAIGDCAERHPLARGAGVEGRVEVDELEALLSEVRQQLEVLAKQDLVAHRPAPAGRGRCGCWRCARIGVPQRSHAA
jgi:hypothetical protein